MTNTTSVTACDEKIYIYVHYFLETNLPKVSNTKEEKEYFENMTNLFYKLGWENKPDKYGMLSFKKGKQSVVVTTNAVVGVIFWKDVSDLAQSINDSQITHVEKIVEQETVYDITKEEYWDYYKKIECDIKNSIKEECTSTKEGESYTVNQIINWVSYRYELYIFRDDDEVNYNMREFHGYLGRLIEEMIEENTLILETDQYGNRFIRSAGRANIYENDAARL